jgi:hypothetical protein
MKKSAAVIVEEQIAVLKQAREALAPVALNSNSPCATRTLADLMATLNDKIDYLEDEQRRIAKLYGSTPSL